MNAAGREASRVRYRLVAVNLVVLAVVLVVTLGAAALTSIRSSDTQLDAELHELAERATRDLSRVVARRDDDRAHGRDRDHDDEDEDDEHHGRARSAPAMQARVLASAIDLKEGDVVLVVATSATDVVVVGESAPMGLPDSDALVGALRGRERYSDAGGPASAYRVLSVPVRAGTDVVAALQIARSRAGADAALSRTLVILGLTGIAGLVLSAVGSLFLAGRAMRPIELALERQRRFIADASHELRTPVAVLRARADLLVADAEHKDRALAGELAQLSRDAAELSELLSELLDLARLDATDVLLELMPVPLADVVEEVALQLRPLAEERGLALATKAQPVFAMANLARLRQVLRALGDNALKHTPRGASVTFEADESAGRARLRVLDEGEGIAPEHLAHVKERFYRADPSRTRAAGAGPRGAGLGLAIAHELVRRMDGELHIESRPGKGTVVTLVLPLAS